MPLSVVDSTPDELYFNLIGNAKLHIISYCSSQNIINITNRKRKSQFEVIERMFCGGVIRFKDECAYHASRYFFCSYFLPFSSLSGRYP